MTEKQIRAKFSGINMPATSDKKIKTLWDFFATRKSHFYYARCAFFADPEKAKKRDIFTFNQGLKHSAAESFDESAITLFLAHVHDIIANGSDEVNEYLLNWVANMLQNPTAKNETVPQLSSLQGVGKTKFFTDVISELLGDYAVPNISNMDSIIGQFNSIIEHKKLAILNEVKDRDTRMNQGAYDSLKTIITDDSIIINEKGVKQRTSQNVLNLMITSNNAHPFNITDQRSSNRSYRVLEQVCESI
jgi:hypothetical protein